MFQESTADGAVCRSTHIRPAAHQTSVPEEQILHSANSGAIVERVGQIRDEFRIEGRKWARELAEYVSKDNVGVATVFIYDEVFGTKDRVHWFIHLKSIDDYERLLYRGVTDKQWRDEIIAKERIEDDKGGGTWNRMFVDGSRQDTVLLPQSWDAPASRDDFAPVPAAAQLSQQSGHVLHSANCALILHRTALPRYSRAEQARSFCKTLAQAWNMAFEGTVSALCYAEGYGAVERIHMLIHLPSLSAYNMLFGPRRVRHAAVDSVLGQDWADGAEEASWADLFVDGSIADTALTPQCWGAYA